MNLVFKLVISSVLLLKAEQSFTQDSAVADNQDTLLYINELGCKLLIYQKTDSVFNYKLSNICQEGACADIEDMEGEAFNMAASMQPGEDALFSEPSTIRFEVLEQGNTIIAEPNPMYVGYDCAGSFDGTFQRKK
jgi:hypothetical protein